MAWRGAKQVVQPAFTAKEIFGLQETAALPLVREIGFDNLCFGLLGVLSFALLAFRLPAAVAGALYFALAGTQHLVHKGKTDAECFAMRSDFFIAAVLVVLLLAA